MQAWATFLNFFLGERDDVKVAMKHLIGRVACRRLKTVEVARSLDCVPLLEKCDVLDEDGLEVLGKNVSKNTKA